MQRSLPWQRSWLSQSYSLEDKLKMLTAHFVSNVSKHLVELSIVTSMTSHNLIVVMNALMIYEMTRIGPVCPLDVPPAVACLKKGCVGAVAQWISGPAHVLLRPLSKACALGRQACTRSVQRDPMPTATPILHCPLPQPRKHLRLAVSSFFSLASWARRAAVQFKVLTMHAVHHTP